MASLGYLLWNRNWRKRPDGHLPLSWQADSGLCPSNAQFSSHFDVESIQWFHTSTKAEGDINKYSSHIWHQLELIIIIQTGRRRHCVFVFSGCPGRRNAGYTQLHRVHIKRCHWLFHNNFYKYARIFMIFGTQMCKWILIILVNLLCCVPCTLPGDVMLTSLKPFTVHVILSPCCRGRHQEFPSKDVGIWPSNSPDLNPVDYSIWGILQERVYRSQIHDVNELKERLLRECRLLDHIIIAAAIVQWRSPLNA